jgi:hypothetical protein
MCCLGDEAETGAAAEGITEEELGAICLMSVNSLSKR